MNMIVPKIAKPYIDLIYTKKELELIEWLEEKTLSKSEIEKISGENCDQVLGLAYRNATVNMVEAEDGSPVKYKVNPIKMRISNMATFQRELWELIPLEVRNQIASWHFHEFIEMKRALDFAGISAKKNKVMPLEVVIEYMKKTAEEVYVIPCDCKSTAEQCDPDWRMICLEFSKEINSAVDRGHGKRLTMDEAEEIIRKADEQGLYHTAEHKGICNCCRCCCYPGRATLELGYKGSWPKVLYQAQKDDSLCIKCGLCVKRCPKEAMVMDGTDIVFKTENCWGCGLCVNTCPTNALHLKELEEWVVPY